MLSPRYLHPDGRRQVCSGETARKDAAAAGAVAGVSWACAAPVAVKQRRDIHAARNTHVSVHNRLHNVWLFSFFCENAVPANLASSRGINRDAASRVRSAVNYGTLRRVLAVSTWVRAGNSRCDMPRIGPACPIDRLPQATGREDQRWYVSLLSGCWLPSRCPRAVTIAERPCRAAIVLCDAQCPADGRAQLASYLASVTGGALPCSGSRACAGAARVRRSNGLCRVAELTPDPSDPRNGSCGAGNDLILTGGRPRGTLYAVYRFLEDVVGVHWWNAYEESVPGRPTLRVDALDRTGTPAFRCRDIYMLYGNDNGRFAARNRLNRDGDSPISGEYGGAMDYGPPYHVHTFMYVPPIPISQPIPNGSRWPTGNARPSGQLCLTNPGLRRSVDKLTGYIEQSRAKARANNAPPPTVFSISQNDWEGMCECDNCQAIAKAEESEAGPLLDFVNHIADAIREDYPEIYIDTLAYMMTQKPPKTIRPRDNVIIRLCDTSSNFTKTITDPVNREFHDHLLRWAAIARNLRIWDYAVTYAPHYGLPMPTAHTYAPDYRFYAEHNVEGVFTEHEYPVLADMRDFKVWMMMKTLEDPYQDYGALVQTFTDGFYGPAGAPIRHYLTRLEQASGAKLSYLSMGASPRQYLYLRSPVHARRTRSLTRPGWPWRDDDLLLRGSRACPWIAPPSFCSPTSWRSGCAVATPETLPLDRDAVAAQVPGHMGRTDQFRVPEAERPAAGQDRRGTQPVARAPGHRAHPGESSAACPGDRVRFHRRHVPQLE